MARVLIVLIVSLATASCGDDESESTTAPVDVAAESPPDKQELISRADAICGQAKIAIDMARTRFHHGNLDQASAAELDSFVADRIVPVYRNEIASLRKLPQPDGDAGDFEAILDAAEKGLDALAADPSELDPRGGSSLLDDSNRLARDYGLAVCIAP